MHDKILCIVQTVNVCVLCEPVSGVCGQDQVLLEHGLPVCFRKFVTNVSWEHVVNTWLYDGLFLISQHICMPILYEFVLQCLLLQLRVHIKPHLDLSFCLQVW